MERLIFQALAAWGAVSLLFVIVMLCRTWWLDRKEAAWRR